ncbi:MAG TPA: efflux RND transporter periplasmic adaptor subunit [Chroococcales cyanobacterium]
MKLGSLATKKNIVLLVIVVVFAGSIVAWKIVHDRNKSREAESSESDEESNRIKVVQVVSRVLQREDQLPGEINAYQDVLMYPKIPGFVKTLDVDRGSVVKEGQLLATMYAPEYVARRNEALAKVSAAKAAVSAEESQLQDEEADLKQKQANLIADQSTYQRVNAASLAPGVVADNDVIQWSQNVEIDRQDVNMTIKRVNAKKHELELRKEELQARTQAFDTYATWSSYLEVRAPFNGYITERKLHIGSFVGPDGKGAYPPICRIKQLDLLRIVAPVPERDTAGVVAGSEVQFSVSAFPNQRFNGTIARISNTLDKETRTMPVELNYFNPQYKILPGMFCQVYWPTRRRQSSLFVPESAVVSTPLETFVCKISEHEDANHRKYKEIGWVSVNRGQKMDDMVEVFSPHLHEGDQVALHASEELENQSHVKTAEATQ